MPKKYRQNYDGEKLLQAIASVKNKNLTLRQASEKFGVPHSTLGDRIKLGISTEKPGKILYIFK